MRRIICFHNPNESNGYLSNWFLSEFKIDNLTFSSMEQYMMYSKAILFDDNEIASQIMLTSNVGKIKALGRCVRNYNESVWNGMRQIIVYKGLVQKFMQNQDILNKLLETEDSILAECSVQDRVWGIGKSMSDDDRYYIDKWGGENLLGYSLMIVRSELRNNKIR